MKPFKTIILSTLMLPLMAFSQCSNGQKLETKAPLEFGEVYYKKKAQAVRDLESVITLYIPIIGENNTIELDSVYFKGKSAKLIKSSQDQNLYFGRFIMKPAYTEDIILSSDIAEEHKNKLPIKESKIPFELLPNQCVLSYIEAGQTKYYKISNIKEKRLNEAPMAPRN
jgi:hypothetical protein